MGLDASSTKIFHWWWLVFVAFSLCYGGTKLYMKHTSSLRFISMHANLETDPEAVPFWRSNLTKFFQSDYDLATNSNWMSGKNLELLKFHMRQAILGIKPLSLLALGGSVTWGRRCPRQEHSHFYDERFPQPEDVMKKTGPPAWFMPRDNLFWAIYSNNTDKAYDFAPSRASRGNASNLQVLCAWPGRLFSFLSAVLPEAMFRVKNKAIPASKVSDIMNNDFNEWLQTESNVIFIDYTVNEVGVDTSELLVAHSILLQRLGAWHKSRGWMPPAVVYISTPPNNRPGLLKCFLHLLGSTIATRTVDGLNANCDASFLALTVDRQFNESKYLNDHGIDFPPKGVRTDARLLYSSLFSQDIKYAKIARSFGFPLLSATLLFINPSDSSKNLQLHASHPCIFNAWVDHDPHPLYCFHDLVSGIVVHYLWSIYKSVSQEQYVMGDLGRYIKRLKATLTTHYVLGDLSLSMCNQTAHPGNAVVNLETSTPEFQSALLKQLREHNASVSIGSPSSQRAALCARVFEPSWRYVFNPIKPHLYRIPETRMGGMWRVGFDSKAKGGLVACKEKTSSEWNSTETSVDFFLRVVECPSGSYITLAYLASYGAEYARFSFEIVGQLEAPMIFDTQVDKHNSMSRLSVFGPLLWASSKIRHQWIRFTLLPHENYVRGSGLLSCFAKVKILNIKCIGHAVL